jgi:hypothetical protein
LITYDVVITALTALENWRQLYFGSTANSGNGADLNDYKKDGKVNLLKYAFGLNPTLSNGTQLPRPQKVGGNFVASFTQPAGVSGIPYGAEWNTTQPRSCPFPGGPIVRAIPRKRIIRSAHELPPPDAPQFPSAFRRRARRCATLR